MTATATTAAQDAALAALVADFDFMAFIGLELTPAEVAERDAPYLAKKAAKEADPYTCCGRCAGEGRINAYHFNAGGICFQCNGTGKMLKSTRRR